MKQTQHQHTFSIRKSVLGTASVMVASFLFIASGEVAQADETTPQATQALTERVQSHNQAPQEQQSLALHKTNDETSVESKTSVEAPKEPEVLQPKASTQLQTPQHKEASQTDTHAVETTSQDTKSEPTPLTPAERISNDTGASKNERRLTQAPTPENQEAQSQESKEVAAEASNDAKEKPQLPSIDKGYSRKILKQEESTTSKDDIAKKETTNAEKTKASESELKTVEAPTTKDTTTKSQFTKQASDKKPAVKAAPDAVQNPEHPKNKNPFVFVHGFNGFVGDVAAKGQNYWGGTKANLQNYLRKAGYETYEASISALASNHERAVELFYFLKGGRVDYGAAHAAKYGHERYGKTYEGVLKDWKPGNPVHFIGHSMGGQTIRLLEHYLRFGNEDEIAYQKSHGGVISDIFTGGHDNMVTSITTIATPHNGTHASDGLGNSPFIRHLLYSFARTSSNLGTIDYGLDQWGFKRKAGESLIDYHKRVAKSKIWDSEDTGLYDLTREGAEKINKKTELNPNIYYKTYTGLATHETQLGKQMVDIGMEFTKILTGNYIGAVKDILWRPNDGLVSVISSQYPSDEKHVEVNENSALQKGTWQVMPTMKGWDHSDFIGNDALDGKHPAGELTKFYDSITDYLMRIEKEKK